MGTCAIAAGVEGLFAPSKLLQEGESESTSANKRESDLI